MPHEEFAEGDLSYYLAALDGHPPALHSDAQIEQGYYRKRRKGGNWTPVVIMIQDDYWVALDDSVAVPADKIAQLFWWSHNNPITREAYDRYMDGGGWADEPPPPIGHNLPDDADEHDKLAFELAAEKELIDDMMTTPIADQEAADRLGIWVTKIRAIGTSAEAQKKIEKRPVLDEAARIETRWSPLLAQVSALLLSMKGHIRPWMDKLETIERERQATARRNAELLRQKAKEMATAARELPYGDDASKAFQEAGKVVSDAQAADREAERQNPQAGRTGAKVKMITVVSALITDYDAALAHVKETPDIRSVVQRLANLAAKARNPIPGTERVERKEVA